MWPFDSTDIDPYVDKPEERPESAGTITDAFSNPWVSIPYALASGFLAGAYPGTARAAQGLNVGLGMGLAGEKNAYEQKKRKRLSEALDKFANSTTPVNVTKPGFSPRATFSEIPDDGFRLSQVWGERQPSESEIGDLRETWGGRMPLAPEAAGSNFPTHEAVEQKPILDPRRREILSLIGKEDPRAALAMVGKSLFAEPKDAPHPVFATQGGEGIESRFDPSTNQWITVRRPLTPAPESPERIEDRLIQRYLQAKSIEDRAQAAKDLNEHRQNMLAQQKDIAEANMALRRDLAETRNEQRGKVTNPADWLKLDPDTNEVEQAPGDMSRDELIRNGYREIKNLKDRERIYSSGTGLDLQFQKVKELAEQYKKTSAPSLWMGQKTGGWVGSAIGNSMEGTARQMIQFLEKELGGVRAAGSKPLLDAATDFLVPSSIDSPEVVDLKMKGLEVLVTGLRDAPRRAAFGFGIDPKTSQATTNFINMVRAQGAKERGEPPPPLLKPIVPMRSNAGAPGATPGMNDLPTPPAGKMLLRDEKTKQMGFYPVGPVPNGFSRLK